jgi:hypothetical protein
VPNDNTWSYSNLSRPSIFVLQVFNEAPYFLKTTRHVYFILHGNFAKTLKHPVNPPVAVKINTSTPRSSELYVLSTPRGSEQSFQPTVALEINMSPPVALNVLSNPRGSKQSFQPPVALKINTSTPRGSKRPVNPPWL